MKDINKLMFAMKNVLELLLEGPKTESELIEIIPNFSLELLGKLETLNAIDRSGDLVWITSRGKYLLNDMRPKNRNMGFIL